MKINKQILKEERMRILDLENDIYIDLKETQQKNKDIPKDWINRYNNAREALINAYVALKELEEPF